MAISLLNGVSAVNTLNTKQIANTAQGPASVSFGDMVSAKVNGMMDAAKGVDTAMHNVAAGTADPLTIGPLLSLAEITLKEVHLVLNKTTQALNDLTHTQV